MLGYCLIQGFAYLKAKAQAIHWVVDHWRDIKESRRRVQSVRRVSDQQVLSTLRWWYDWDQFAVLARQRGGWLYEVVSGLFAWRAHDRTA